MSEQVDQPRRYDAVIGGQNLPPVSGVVLGGLEGVKRRIGDGSIEIKIAALQEALKYGQEGLDLVIQALEDSSSEIQWSAYSLLKERQEPSVKAALQDYIPVIYRNLRDLLTAQKWKSADQETAAVMLKVADREAEGWLRVEDIHKFPAVDLRMIDQLWRQHSNGRFGLSVQQQVWQRVGTNYAPFGDRVGWRRGFWLSYSQLNFSATAPEGHLPAAHLSWDSLKRGQTWLWYGGSVEDVRWFEVKSLLSRRDLSGINE